MGVPITRAIRLIISTRLPRQVQLETFVLPDTDQDIYLMNTIITRTTAIVISKKQKHHNLTSRLVIAIQAFGTQAKRSISQGNQASETTRSAIFISVNTRQGRMGLDGQ